MIIFFQADSAFRQKYVISPDKGLITRYQSVADISLIYQADPVVVHSRLMMPVHVGGRLADSG